MDQREGDDRGEHDRHPRPGADPPAVVDRPERDQPEEDLRQPAELDRGDAAAEDAAARRTPARALAPFLRGLRLGRLLRALLEQLVVLRHYVPTFRSSSSSSRSRFDGFFGTWIFNRARTSPRPEPFSFGAPLPLTRSIFPSSDPAGTFTFTSPSGVGTATVVPSAASAKATGTSTTRSSPRRVKVFDGCTRVIT